MARRKKYVPPAKALIWLAVAAIVLLGSGLLRNRVQVPEDSSFEIHFIDVGQADAALVLCDGQAMLIDGGNPSDSSRIYAYLKQRGIDDLAYIVCTHAHADHAGGLAGALNYARVGDALAPVTEDESKSFSNFRKYLDEQGVDITVPQPGDKFDLGSAEVTVLGPVEAYTEVNNTSLVLRIVYGRTSFLFTGDMEQEAEKALVASGRWLASTVLKVGHHGSDSSSSYAFLQAVRPRYAVISVGEDNEYGHPDAAVLQRLEDLGTVIYRTDRDGDILLTSNGQNVTFQTANAP